MGCLGTEFHPLAFDRWPAGVGGMRGVTATKPFWLTPPYWLGDEREVTRITESTLAAKQLISKALLLL
jgi:hypothetical protein